MSQFIRSYFAICMLLATTASASVARCDNGTVVSGTVIAIDAANQIMRVYVTAVDGQTLVGGPDTNYVDYLVSPNTAVLNDNNQIISQSNVQVGSRIQMQFSGAYASRILLFSGIHNGNSGSFVTGVPNYASGNVQNYTTVQSYSSHRQPYLQCSGVHYASHLQPALNSNHLHHHHHSKHSPSSRGTHSGFHAHLGSSQHNHPRAR